MACANFWNPVTVMAAAFGLVAVYLIVDIVRMDIREYRKRKP